MQIPSQLIELLDTTLPHKSKVFNAFNLSPPERAKVILIGQDPYYSFFSHNGEKRPYANGLAFSVDRDAPLPKSLVNIYKELVSDIGCDQPVNGDLTPWAKQGVLLANTALTVLPDQPGVHAKDWKSFTEGWIKKAGAADATKKVWILWGGHAQSYEHLIDNSHSIIKSAHPSPLSAYKGFFGSKPFSKANQLLIELGHAPIDWSLS